LSDLKPGTNLSVYAIPAGDDHPAMTVVRAEWPKCLAGLIADIDGTNVIISHQSKDITVRTDEKTKILIGQHGPGIIYTPAKLGSLDDLAPGMLVKVFTEKGIATKIYTPGGMGMTPGGTR
jgi:hypothetical protein